MFQVKTLSSSTPISTTQGRDRPGPGVEDNGRSIDPTDGPDTGPLRVSRGRFPSFRRGQEHEDVLDSYCPVHVQGTPDLLRGGSRLWTHRSPGSRGHSTLTYTTLLVDLTWSKPSKISYKKVRVYTSLYRLLDLKLTIWVLPVHSSRREVE